MTDKVRPDIDEQIDTPIPITSPPQAEPLTEKGTIWVFTWNEIVNGTIQLISVIAALIFGVWAVKSFNAAQEANSLAQTALHQALIANQLTMLSVCASDQTIGNSSACVNVFAAISLDNIVSALSLVPTIQISPTPLPPSPPLTSQSTITVQTTSFESPTIISGESSQAPSSSFASSPNTVGTPPTTTAVLPSTPFSITPTQSSTTSSSPLSGSPQTPTKQPLPIAAIIGIVACATGSVALIIALYIGWKRMSARRMRTMNL